MRKRSGTGLDGEDPPFQPRDHFRQCLCETRSTLSSKGPAASRKRPSALLEDQTVLLESVLDSLCFAIIVSRLEDDLGVDPFTTADNVTFPVTLGDFVRFYEAAV